MKNAFGNLINIALNLCIALIAIVISPIFSPFKNMMDLSICLCHLWFLSSVSYSFSECRSFVSLGGFIPKGSCFCCCNGKRIFFLKFLSHLSWLVYSESGSCSVVSHSLPFHGPYSPWNSPGQNTGVGRLSLLQGIFPGMQEISVN